MMKKINLIWVLAACFAQAGVPLPSVTYFGVIRDAHGYPYTEDAEICLMHGTQEVVSYQVAGLRDMGINYQVEIEMDSGGTSYAAYAVHSGDLLDIKVRYQGVEMPVTPVNQLRVPEFGGTRRLDLMAAVDSDGDGLPDAWEQLLIQQSGGVLLTMEDVNPGDDFDGDGMSNRKEFLSGTFPFLAYDRLALDRLEQLENGRLKFEFLSIDGFSYRIQQTGQLKTEDWSDLPVAFEPDAETVPQVIAGDGYFKTVYFSVDNASKFVRLTVK